MNCVFWSGMAVFYNCDGWMVVNVELGGNIVVFDAMACGYDWWKVRDGLFILMLKPIKFKVK